VVNANTFGDNILVLSLILSLYKKPSGLTRDENVVQNKAVSWQDHNQA
jgi:hypothetical protein